MKHSAPRGSIRSGKRGGESGRKRVRREVNRALHRNWNFANRFLLALVLLYLIPTALELYFGGVYWSDACENGLHYWMVVDAFITAAFILNYVYSVYIMHSGLTVDPELNDYLISRGRKYDEDEVQRLELKYTLLHKKSNVCPRSVSGLPFCISCIGSSLWLDARGNDSPDDCPEVLVSATGAISITKVIAPMFIGTIYGLSFLFLMTGVRRSSDGTEKNNDESSDEEVELS
jgi:hypothetical protein